MILYIETIFLYLLNSKRHLIPLNKASVISKTKSFFVSLKYANKNRRAFLAIRMLSVHFWEKFGQYFRGDALSRPLSTIGVHIHRGD